MREYQFINKGTFESLAKFEKKLNNKAMEGWRVVNIITLSSGVVALLEKVK